MKINKIIFFMILCLGAGLVLSGCTSGTPPSDSSSSSSSSSTSSPSTSSTPSSNNTTETPAVSSTPSNDGVSGLDGEQVTGTEAPSTGFGAKVAAAAKKLIGSTSFRGADVNYGRLACAKVVSTALKAAGAIENVMLNVRDLVAKLRGKGWTEVTPPPFKEGDVITWATYDYNKDGKIDNDTHVGIMVKNGGSFRAMNNSSSLRTPRYSDPYSMRVSRVLRKAA